MSDFWDSIVGVLGAAVLPVGAWVGTIQQRVSNSEARHTRHEEHFAKITDRIDEHIRITNATNVAVGQMNGKLDILVAKHISDAKD